MTVKALSRGRGLGWTQSIAGVAGVLVVAELASRTGVLPSEYFPPVSEMFAVLFGQFGEGSFWVAVGQTLQGWALGLGIAALLAIPIGMLLGTSVWRYRAFRAVIEFLRPVPSVALVPLAILIYGTGLESKLFLAVFASFWPILVQTMYGMQDVDPVAVDTARAFRLTRTELVTRVVLPSAVPYVATGLRISSAVALILSITAELLIGNTPGLGKEISEARTGGADTLLYALIIATGLLGWGLNTVFATAEKRVLHWHPSQRGAQ